MNNHRVILLLLSITYLHSLTAGFVAETLIKLGPTSKRIRYIPIEQVQKRKFIYSYDLHDTMVERLVTQTNKNRVSKYIRIIVDEHQIDTSCDQLFFAPLECTWIRAEQLAPGMCLLRGTDDYVFIDDVIEINDEVLVYDITVQQFHNFYVSEYDIVVHNFLPLFTVGVVWVIGGGFELSSIYATVAAAGVILGGLLSKKHTPELNHHLPQSQYTAKLITAYQPPYSNTPVNLSPIIFPSSSDIPVQYASNNCPPDCFNRIPDYQSTLTSTPESEFSADDVLVLMGKNKDYKKPKQENNRPLPANGDPNDDDPRSNRNFQKKYVSNENSPSNHPHGKYQDAPYHHSNSNGGNGKGMKSPAPKNGQAALDSSIPINSNSKRRVGISEGEIVILSRTLEDSTKNIAKDLYHGHVLTWKQISKDPNLVDVKNALLRAKLVDKYGTILI